MNSEATLESTNSFSIRKTLYFIIKRLFDIVCSLIGCIFLLPIALIVKISYLLSGDTKTIFYKQKRIGKNGEFIYIYKFRSMVVNADEVLKELLVFGDTSKQPSRIKCATLSANGIKKFLEEDHS